jgi:GT2 family glycosyltransferase
MEDSQPEAPSIQVSVLIVSHNSVDSLHRALAALEQSKGRETMEILVVDNGSRDGSATIDNDFPGVTVLRLPRHFGMTKARNIGIRTAKGDYLLLLSPDVEVAPDTVSALITAIEHEPSALAVGPLVVDESGAPISEGRQLPDASTLARFWRTGIPGRPVEKANVEPFAVELHDGRALLLRKQTIRGINYFDERFGEAWGDTDLAYQIRRAGRKILLLPDARATVREALPRRDDLPFEADRASGAAAYAGKYFGFLSGLGLRLKIALGALFSGQIGLFLRAMEGRKIDGNDPEL